MKDWQAWLDAFGVGNVDPEKGDIYPNLDNAIKGAMTGSGVVVADVTLCRDELEQGTLVMPFPEMITDSEMGDFCVLYSGSRQSDPPIQVFLAWLDDKALLERQRLEAQGLA